MEPVGLSFWVKSKPDPSVLQLADCAVRGVQIYAEQAIQHIREKHAADRLYVHLTWQAVHGTFRSFPTIMTTSSYTHSMQCAWLL